jgi:hypothetical protein
MISIKQVIAVASLAIMVTGCVSMRDSMIKDGYPPAYADGFVDGTHSGKQAAGDMFSKFKKDVRRFESDSDYAKGWKDGFRQGEAHQKALQQQNSNAIEQQRLSEEVRHDKWQEHHDSSSDLLKGVDTKGLEKLK